MCNDVTGIASDVTVFHGSAFSGKKVTMGVSGQENVAKSEKLTTVLEKLDRGKIRATS
jgi:hypothetical protein